jgi:hypothetical protein
MTEAINELECAIVRERGKLNALKEKGMELGKRFSIVQHNKDSNDILNCIGKINHFEQAIKHLHNVSQS